MKWSARSLYQATLGRLQRTGSNRLMTGTLEMQRMEVQRIMNTIVDGLMRSNSQLIYQTCCIPAQINIGRDRDALAESNVQIQAGETAHRLKEGSEG